MAEPANAHCGRALVEIGALRACPTCRRVFRSAGGGLEELRGPVGVRVRWYGEGASAPSSYRDAALPGEVTLALERFWLARWAVTAPFAAFAACFLVLWGGLATAAGLGIAGGTLHVAEATAVAVGIGVLGLAGGAGYLAAALFVNRTHITISPSRIRRTDGPLRWRGRPPIEIDRRDGDEARTAQVLENDLRNLSARWPAPRFHQVAITRQDRTEALVLVEQIATEASAEAVRALVAELLAATAAT